MTQKNRTHVRGKSQHIHTFYFIQWLEMMRSKVGEQLHFRINCNGNTSGDMTCWYPTITYISSEYQNQYAPGAEEPEETLPVYSVKDGYTTPSDAAESEVVSINQADNIWQFGSYSSEEGYRLFILALKLMRQTPQSQLIRPERFGSLVITIRPMDMHYLTLCTMRKMIGV